jgi:outer membrane protein assembly factor BamD
LLKYPQSNLVTEATQHLREVQEVLAEGDFRVARFYYLRHSYRAAGARLIQMTARYPLYSQADRANWMIAEIYQRVEKNNFAALYYARIVRDYPLSPLAGQAKQKLLSMNVPVPQPDPDAMARMKQEQLIPREKKGLLQRSLNTPKGMVKGSPDVAMAAHVGQPNLNTEEENPDNAILTPTGNSIGGGGRAGAGNSVSVETVPAGSAPPATAEPAPETTPPATAAPPAEAPAPAANPPTDGDGSPKANAFEPGANPGAPAAAPGGSATVVAPASNPSSAPATANGGAPQTAAPQGAMAQTQSDQTNSNSNDNGKESSSKKKKKGIHKIIPW